MKATKRVLGIVLALAMGLALFAPMASAETDRYKPIITMQPQASSKRVYFGKKITLELQADLPDDSDGTLRYEWNANDKKIEGAASPKLTTTITLEEAQAFTFNVRYMAVVYCDFTENGQQGSRTTAAREVQVEYKTSFADTYRAYFIAVSEMFDEMRNPRTGIDGFLNYILAPIATIFFFPLIPLLFVANYYGWFDILPWMV